MFKLSLSYNSYNVFILAFFYLLFHNHVLICEAKAKLWSPESALSLCGNYKPSPFILREQLGESWHWNDYVNMFVK